MFYPSSAFPSHTWGIVTRSSQIACFTRLCFVRLGLLGSQDESLTQYAQNEMASNLMQDCSQIVHTDAGSRIHIFCFDQSPIQYGSETTARAGKSCHHTPMYLQARSSEVPSEALTKLDSTYTRYSPWLPCSVHGLA